MTAGFPLTKYQTALFVVFVVLPPLCLLSSPMCLILTALDHIFLLFGVIIDRIIEENEQRRLILCFPTYFHTMSFWHLTVLLHNKTCYWGTYHPTPHINMLHFKILFNCLVLFPTAVVLIVILSLKLSYSTCCSWKHLEWLIDNLKLLAMSMLNKKLFVCSVFFINILFEKVATI